MTWYNEINICALGAEPFPYIFHFVENEIDNFEVKAEEPIIEVTLKFMWDWASNSPKATLIKRNPIACTIYGDNPLYKKTFEMTMLQDQRTANLKADEILKSSSLGEVLVSFRHNIRSMYVEENDPVVISHKAGLDENGYVKAEGYVIKRVRNNIEIDYVLSMLPINEKLLDTELVSLSFATGAGTEQTLSFVYRDGTLIATVFADIEGHPPLQGAKIVIAGNTQFTNSKGQAYFKLDPGTYTAILTAPGYEDKVVTNIYL